METVTVTILADHEILQAVHSHEMISPCMRNQIRGEFDGDKLKKVISYGLSSFGYDARVGDVFKTMENYAVDPKDCSELNFNKLKVVDGADGSEHVWLPPNSHTLCHTIERFKMPSDVMAICLGKSTYARCGVIVNCTPLEPEWEGQVTLELSNTSSVPVKVYCGEGICQFVFFRGERPAVTYAERAGGPGKYQNQSGIVLPRV